MVRHAKSALDSQPSHQTKSVPGVSKTEMRLLAAEESRSRAAERNSFPGVMLQLRQNSGRCLQLCLACGFKDQLRQHVQLCWHHSHGSVPWRLQVEMNVGGKGKTFLMGIHPRSDQKHTMS